MTKKTSQLEPLALTAQQIVNGQIVPHSLRTWRRMDSAGQCPSGFNVGGRKVWRLSDLKLWEEWGFPDRQDFNARLRAESPARGRWESMHRSRSKELQNE